MHGPSSCPWLCSASCPSAPCPFPCVPLVYELSCWVWMERVWGMGVLATRGAVKPGEEMQDHPKESAVSCLLPPATESWHAAAAGQVSSVGDLWSLSARLHRGGHRGQSTLRNLSRDNWGGAELASVLGDQGGPSQDPSLPLSSWVSFQAIAPGPGGTWRLAGSGGPGRSSKTSPCTSRAGRSCASWAAQVSLRRALNSPEGPGKAAGLDVNTTSRRRV